MIKNYKDFNQLNEKVDQYDFEFNTTIVSKDITFYNEPVDKSKEQYIDIGDFNIHWEMDFDNRKYGINSMGPIINKLSGSYMLVTPLEEKDSEEEIELSIDKNSDWEFINQFSSTFEFGNAILPRDVEVDFKTKKITINY